MARRHENLPQVTDPFISDLRHRSTVTEKPSYAIYVFAGAVAVGFALLVALCVSLLFSNERAQLILSQQEELLEVRMLQLERDNRVDLLDSFRMTTVYVGDNPLESGADINLPCGSNASRIVRERFSPLSANEEFGTRQVVLDFREVSSFSGGACGHQYFAVATTNF